MTVPAVANNQQMTRHWLRVQALAGLGVTALAGMMTGGVAAYSAVFGSLAVYVPGLMFALIVARRFGADSTAFLRAAVLAEGAKWLFCGVICTAVFLGVEPLAAGWFFAGMGTVILAGWLGLIFSS